MRRRALLGGLAGLACPAASQALPLPSGPDITFNVIRHGKVIGMHRLVFTRSGDALTVAVAADIVLMIGPVAVFRYRHRATEQWWGEQVISVESETNDDGTPERMSAERRAEGLVVRGGKIAPYVAPEDALPATHWNRRMMSGPLINTQDGRLMRPTVMPVGTDRVPVGGGEAWAERFALRGDAHLDLWYDAVPAWVALLFVARDGSEVRFERT